MQLHSQSHGAGPPSLILHGLFGSLDNWHTVSRKLSRNYPHLNEAIRVGRKFNKPTLFIRGALSDYLGEEDFPLIEELFPQAEIETLPGADHWVHAEVPDLLVRTVSSFLKSN
jgi:esterase